MSKAVLVMDMPETCNECRYCSHKGYSYPCCALTNYAGGHKSMILEDIYSKKQNWCPLRELVEKIESNDLIETTKENDCFDGCEDEVAYYQGKSDGWNACIDAITGGKE